MKHKSLVQLIIEYTTSLISKTKDVSLPDPGLV